MTIAELYGAAEEADRKAAAADRESNIIRRCCELGDGELTEADHRATRYRNNAWLIRQFAARCERAEAPKANA